MGEYIDNNITDKGVLSRIHKYLLQMDKEEMKSEPETKTWVQAVYLEGHARSRSWWGREVETQFTGIVKVTAIGTEDWVPLGPPRPLKVPGLFP